MKISDRSRLYSTMKVFGGTCLVLLVPAAGAAMTDAPLIWPISTLLYNLGLLFCFALVRRKMVRVFVYDLVAAILFLVECSYFFSHYLQNAGFNDAFFYHLRPDLIYAGISEFLPFLLGGFALLSGFLFPFSSYLNKAKPGRSLLAFPGFSLLVFGLALSPPLRDLVGHMARPSPAKVDSAVYAQFTNLLDRELSIEFSRSEKPNIVLIYAEGLNQSYFDEKVFPGLLPNLRRIRKQSIDFSNVAQGVGAGWTIAGMVASQCGYPLADTHGIDGNDFSIFDDFLPRATCLGDLLEKDGYQLTFIGGADARFAGKADFLRSHGYREILDRDIVLGSLADASYRNWWGAYDDTLFAFALGKFAALSKEKSPFLLTLLTLDTHGNNGYLSRSCGPFEEGENSTLNAFHCTDQLISGFIEQIRRSPFSDKTIIVVVSDHLEFENQASSLLEASTMPDRLTFFVNMPDGTQQHNDHAGLHYDIAPTILDLVGYSIKGQMGFGAPLTRGDGYLPRRFGMDKWQDLAVNLLAIGRRMWDKEVTLDRSGIRLLVQSATLVFGSRDFNLRSRGFSDVPGSVIFIFDESTYQLLQIKFYQLDRELTPETLGEELLRHKEKLVLAMSRAEYLIGFSDPGIDSKKWVFFLGKPGGETFFSGAINGDFFIPFQMIRELARSRMDDRIVRQRENLLKALRGEPSPPRIG